MSKINTVIALQKPVRPATGGEPAGAPLFILRREDIVESYYFDESLRQLLIRAIILKICYNGTCIRIGAECPV